MTQETNQPGEEPAEASPVASPATESVWAAADRPRVATPPSADGQTVRARASVPPAARAEKQADSRCDRCEEIDFSGADQSEECGQQQEKKRHAKKAFGGEGLRDRK